MHLHSTRVRTERELVEDARGVRLDIHRTRVKSPHSLWCVVSMSDIPIFRFSFESQSNVSAVRLAFVLHHYFVVLFSRPDKTMRWSCRETRRRVRASAARAVIALACVSFSTTRLSNQFISNLPGQVCATLAYLHNVLKFVFSMPRVLGRSGQGVECLRAW